MIRYCTGDILNGLKQGIPLEELARRMNLNPHTLTEILQNNPHNL